MEILYFSWLLPYKCHAANLIYDEFTSLNIGFITWIISILFMCFFEITYRDQELTMQAKALGNWKNISMDAIKSINYK